MLAPLPALIVSLPFEPDRSSAFLVPVIVNAVVIELSSPSFQISVPVDVATTEPSTAAAGNTPYANSRS